MLLEFSLTHIRHLFFVIFLSLKLKTMEERNEARRSQFKDLFTAGLERRVRAAKIESDESRKSLIKSLREASLVDAEQASPAELRARRLFAKTFMFPDSMIAVPENLGRDWLVLLRPEGQRCLVVLSSNTVTLRGRNGAVLGSFVLDPFAVKKTDSVAVFDAMYGFDESSMRKTVFIFDVLLLKGNELIFSDFEFRQFFLKEHWPFVSGSVPVLGGFEAEDVPEFRLVESLPASQVEKLYSDPSPFTPDSLQFFKRTGKYVNGLSGETLLFRDEHLSRFAIDTKHDEGFDGKETMEIVLSAKIGKADDIVEFKTWDGVVLHTAQRSTAPRWLRDRLKKGSVLTRCEVSNSFEFLKLTSSGKPFANSFHRIVDQFRKRRVALNLPPLGIELMDSPPLAFPAIVAVLVPS